MKRFATLALLVAACSSYAPSSRVLPSRASAQHPSQQEQEPVGASTAHAGLAPGVGADKREAGSAEKVDVATLPSEIAVKQIKDSIDRTIMWCTVILTIVGVVGTCAAVKTLREVKRQADTLEDHRTKFEELAKAARDNAISALKNAEATEKNAAAAKASADALINAERAWVIADLVQMAVRMPPPENWCRITASGGLGAMGAEAILKGEHLRHRLRFTNMGRTAARITAFECHSGFYDHKCGILQIERIDYNGDYNRMLAAGSETFTDQTIDINQFVSDPIAVEIGPPSWKNWMVVIVSVTYDHVFSSEGPQREDSRFVYDINAQTMRRVALAQGDREQIGKRETWPRNAGQPN